MKRLENREVEISSYKEYRAKIGVWGMASFIHCLMFSIQEGFLFTYVFKVIFGTIRFLLEKFLNGSKMIFVLQVFEEAPYIIYGTLMCLLCLHLGRSKLKSKRGILSWIVILSFAHQAMVSSKLNIFVVFYMICIIITIFYLLRLRAFKKTFLFDWPLCKCKPKYKFNGFVLFVTILITIVICGVISIPEKIGISLLSIIAVLFKMEYLENFTEYYDLTYEKIFRQAKKR